MCNKCGENKAYETIINLSFGYDSKFDNQKWQMSLCEDCLEDIVKTFKVVPTGFKQDDNYWIDTASHQKVFEQWKETGEWDSLKGLTYDELVALNGYFKTEYINERINKYYPGMPLLENRNPFAAYCDYGNI